MSRPFAVIGFTVFFTIAVLFKFETGVTVIALLLFAAALVVAISIKSLRKNRTVICSIISVIIACLLLLSSVCFSYLPAADYKDKTCDISAFLIGEPEYRYGNYYYDSQITRIDSKPVELNARLTFNKALDAEPYDVINGIFTFYLPGSSNDIYLSSNKANGVFLGAYSTENKYDIVKISRSEKPFYFSVYEIRQEIRNAVYRVLPNENGALAVALLIGDKSGLPADILNDFSFIGITHIICVSGYHLTLWSMLAFEILRKTRLNSRIASLICIIPVVLMMLISGMTYSVLRAGIMMIIYLLSNVFMRKRDSLNSLGFALMLISVFNPFASGSASLQLSALSTAGIILYSEFIAARIDEKIKTIRFGFLRRAVRYWVFVFMVTFSATAFTIPVSLFIYNRFNFMMFAANMVAVPVSGICMVLCALGAFFGCFLTDIINVPAYFGGVISKFLIELSDLIAEIKHFSFSIERDETAVIIVSLMMICLFAVILSYYGKSFPQLTAILCSAVFTFLIVAFSLSDKSITKINVSDCGNGTAVVLSKGDESILIGCGGSDFSGAQTVCDALSETDNDLTAVFIPSFDDCSSSYFVNVINEFIPEEVFCACLPPDLKPLVSGSRINGFETEKTFEYFKIKTAVSENNHAILAENEDLKVTIIFDPVINLNTLPHEFQNSDLIISRNDYPVGTEDSDTSMVVVNAENQRGLIIQEELNNKGIKCAATAGCGNIIIKADNGNISSYREA